MTEKEEHTEKIIQNAEEALSELVEAARGLKQHTERVDAVLSRYTFTVLVSAAEGVFTPAEFEALGGAPAVRKAVRILYDKMMADPQLAHYFEGVDLIRLRQQQVKMFLALFGARDFEVRDLRLAHANHPITHEDFDKMMHHLTETLTEVGMGDKDIQAVATKVRAYEDEVVNDD